MKELNNKNCCLNSWVAIQETETGYCQNKKHDEKHHPNPTFCFELERVGEICSTARKKFWVCWRDASYYQVLNLCQKCKSIMELDSQTGKYFCSDCEHVKLLEDETEILQ